MRGSEITLFAFEMLLRINQVVNGHRDGGFHYVRRKKHQDETLANQLAIKPWSSKHAATSDVTDAVLTPIREKVIRTHVQNGSSVSSLAEPDLMFASIYPFQTESFITFDLSQADIFNEYAAGNKEHLLDAKLQLFSLKRLPSDTTYDVVVRDGNEPIDSAKNLWRLDSSMDNHSSCANSNNCWIKMDVTDGLLWSVEQQRNTEDWNPLQSLTFIIRIKVPRQQAKVSGSFASSKYNGGSFSPKLTLEFSDQARDSINHYSSGLVSQKKPDRKHIVKGVTGPKKKPRNDFTAKTKNNAGAVNSAGVRPVKDSANNGIQYYTYIIIQTEDYPEKEKKKPGRKYLVKGVKGPRKKPKNNNALNTIVRATRRPSTRPSNRPSRRPTKRPSTRPTKRPSTRPTKRPSNNSGSFQFNNIKPNTNDVAAVRPMLGSENAGNWPHITDNVSGGGLNGPSGPNVAYNQGDRPHATYSQNGSPTMSDQQASGPNGPIVSYSANGVGENGGPNGPSAAYSQNSGPSGPSVSYSGQSAGASRIETKKWYMNYQIAKCVRDCSKGDACGGVANFWDMLFDSQAICCQQMNSWNPNCIDD
ncbi:hypothetical protein ACHAWX_001664 [Stephanocyclus meneghinianus]